MRTNPLLLLPLLATIGWQIAAQALVPPIADLNPGPTDGAYVGSAPDLGYFVHTGDGDYTLFAASDALHGRELWTTDGTPAGTRLLKDIAIGAAGSSPRGFVSYGPWVYFAADDGRTGVELWRTDGTAAGTVLIADIRPGPIGSEPHSMAVPATGGVYFSANDGVHGRELWRSEGTVATTSLVADVRVGSASAMTTSSWILSAYGPSLYFAANDGNLGEELWAVSANTASLYADLRPGASGSTPRLLDRVDSLLCLAADDGVIGRELLVVNLENATVTALDLNPGPSGSDPENMSHNIFSKSPIFAATTAATGREPWKLTTYPGLSATLVADINPGPASSAPTILNIGLLLEFVLLAATHPTTGRELWKSDGTTAGTALLADIRPGPESSSPDQLSITVVNHRTHAIFVANDGQHGTELWKTDHTTAGTRMVKDIRPGAAGANPVLLERFPFGCCGSKHLLVANDGISLDEPWLTDGTEVGTVMLRDIGANTPSTLPMEITAVADAGYALFAGTHQTLGRELCRSNGQSIGTYVVKDIRPLSDSNPTNLCPWNRRTYFSANDGVSGAELWVSDGTNGGTQRLMDIHAGPDSASPGPFVPFQRSLYFAALDRSGRELWRTDGTAAGTVLVKDIYRGSGSSNPSDFCVVGNVLYFSAHTPNEGMELWKTDGTTAGTVLVRDINLGAFGSAPVGNGPIGHEKIGLSGILLFVANGVLWRSNGTAAGTTALPLGIAGSYSAVRDLTVLGNRVIYSAEFTTANGALGRELAVGLTNVAVSGGPFDIQPGPVGSDPRSLTVVGAHALFGATTGTYGRELWRTNGFAPGTVLVRDINPGAADSLYDSGSYPLRFSIAADATSAWFAASDGERGVELWRTDGTTAGTTLQTDIGPGAAGSFPVPATPMSPGGTLLFAATAASGRELYGVVDMAGAPSSGSGCAGSGQRVPALSTRGRPRIGNPTFALCVDDARPLSATVVLVGLATRQQPLGNGCNLAIDLAQPHARLLGATDAHGSQVLTLPIPGDRNLSGTTLFAQAATFDPAGTAPAAFALSGSLEITVE